MSRVPRYTAVILLTLAGVVILWQVAGALILFLLSLATAAALRPAVKSYTLRGIPRTWALFLTYIPAFTIPAGLLILASGPLILDIRQGADSLLNRYTVLRTDWLNADTPLLQTVGQQLPPPENVYTALLGEQGLSAIQAAVTATAKALNVAGVLSIMIVLSAYWSLDHVHFEHLWLSLLPTERRTQARDTWRAMENRIGAYVRGEFLLSILTGILLWLGYWALPSDYATLLALFASVARLIPYLGIVIAIIPPLFAGMTAGPLWGIVAVVYTVVIIELLEIVLRPRLGCCERHSSVLLILIVLTLGDAFGAVGLILAPPLTVAIQVLFDHMIQPPATQATPEVALETTETPEVFKDLQERLVAMRHKLAEADQPPSPEVSNLIERLDDLLHQVHLYLRW